MEESNEKQFIASKRKSRECISEESKMLNLNVLILSLVITLTLVLIALSQIVDITVWDNLTANPEWSWIFVIALIAMVWMLYAIIQILMRKKCNV